MERAEQLLEKLSQQLRDKAGRDPLLMTLRLLQAEVLEMHRTAPPETGDKRISVILPGMDASISPAQPTVQPGPVAEDRIVEVLQLDAHEIEAELQLLRDAAELRNKLAVQGRMSQSPPDGGPEDNDPVEGTLPAAPPEASSISGAQREVNQAMITGESSLNDRLKGTERELSERLQHEPVRDLKKAIGINDRYLYINELFKGSEDAFEQAVRTLNAFSILPEAQYFLERELVQKLGWKPDDKLAMQFAQLVRRRFS